MPPEKTDRPLHGGLDPLTIRMPYKADKAAGDPADNELGQLHSFTGKHETRALKK